MPSLLVTGAAGFIGFHLCQRLLESGEQVVGIDNLNSYYDVQLKRDRLRLLQQHPQFEFHPLDLCDAPRLLELFASHSPHAVVNLAAQAGVRHSLSNPRAYIDSNVTGFLNVLEGCRHSAVKHLVFASSSSVYGATTTMPFSTHQPVDHPVSLYAATKRSNELMAHSYAHLFALPCTGLRFFTVYGPWGRPDMAVFLFTRAILAGQPIDLFNQGRMQRDFTYIDDVTEAIVRLIGRPPAPDPLWDGNHADPACSAAPFRLYNVGNQSPVELQHLVHTLERELGRKAVVNLLPMQPGDVASTFADIDDLAREVGFHPDTTIETGIAQFVAWYRDYYGDAPQGKYISDH
ncbi:MAG: NAD-dependent epimerase [Planctomycetales bacterium]